MTKGLKRKLLNMVRSAIKKKARFHRVEMQIPDPAALDSANIPAAFLFWLPSTLGYLTNTEKRAELRFAVLGYIESNVDLELAKADLADELEDALEDLQSDDAFREIAVQIKVTRVDPGPLPLRDLGIGAGVFHPFGAVRLDGEIEYDYDQQD